MPKKLILINPVGRRSGYLLSKISTFMPLNLAYVAAVTPDNWEVEIIDEIMEEFQYKEADLVGITSFTTTINRAYSIANLYRQRGIKVIMGGIHASVLPNEALKYVDSVIIGEVELIWKEVIKDFEQNQLKQIYKGLVVQLENFHILPRRDLLSPKYFWTSIQTSRGCPFDCEFCSVTNYMGKIHRQKRVEHILSELETIKNNNIFFIDDNLVGYGKNSEERAISLFKGMVESGMQKKWWMQTSLNTAENVDLLKYARESGCQFVLIGIEGINKETLKQMRKGINLKIGISNFKRTIENFHKHGIGVVGAFIIGNDFEDKNYFKSLVDFILEVGIDVVQISVLTPIPGSNLFERLNKEGNLKYTDFPEDWDKYRFSYIVHNPKGVTEQDIYNGNNYIKKKIYTPFSFFYRMSRSFLAIKNFDSFYSIYQLNKAFKTSWKNTHYYNMNK